MERPLGVTPAEPRGTGGCARVFKGIVVASVGAKNPALFVTGCLKTSAAGFNTPLTGENVDLGLNPNGAWFAGAKEGKGVVVPNADDV